MVKSVDDGCDETGLYLARGINTVRLLSLCSVLCTVPPPPLLLDEVGGSFRMPLCKWMHTYYRISNARIRFSVLTLLNRTCLMKGGGVLSILPSLLVSILTMARLSPGVLVILRYRLKPTCGFGAVRNISGGFSLLHVITMHATNNILRSTPIAINDINVTAKRKINNKFRSAFEPKSRTSR